MPDAADERARQDAWEKEQLAHARGGNTQAFGAVLKSYETRLFSLVRHFVGRAAEAEELTQEVFLQAFKSQARFDTNRPFRPWLYRIAVNVCQNHRRHSSRRELTLPVCEPTTPMWIKAPASPEQTANARADAEALHHHLARLGDKDRQLLVLRFWEELDYADLKLVYGLPESVLKMRVHRALQSLRRLVVGEAT